MCLLVGGHVSILTGVRGNVLCLVSFQGLLLVQQSLSASASRDTAATSAPSSAVFARGSVSEAAFVSSSFPVHL